MINRPTRITCHSASLIDNIFTNNFDNLVVNGLLYADISDHLPIFSIMIDDENCLAVTNRTIQTYRDMSDENIENFKDRLTHCEWSPLLKEINPSYAYSTFIDKFTSTYNECFPVKKSSNIGNSKTMDVSRSFEICEN